MHLIGFTKKFSESVISTPRQQNYFRRAQLGNTLGAGLKVTTHGTYSCQCALGD